LLQWLGEGRKWRKWRKAGVMLVVMISLWDCGEGVKDGEDVWG